MAVPTVISDLSATLSSNVPTGGEAIGTNADNYLRAHAGFIRQLANGAALHGADVASASTLNLDASTGIIVDVTGTTTITAITLADGSYKIVRFTGALTLTHGASLVLPGGANITTVAGDYAIFVGYASSVVRCALYSPITVTGTGSAVRATSPTLVTPNIGVATGTSFNSLTGAADQADMETATSTVAVVTPGRLQYHPGVAKAWVKYTTDSGSPVSSATHNIASLTDTATGTTSINLTTPFSGTNYVAVASMESTGFATVNITDADTVIVTTYNTSGVATDAMGKIFVVFFGDQ